MYSIDEQGRDFLLKIKSTPDDFEAKRAWWQIGAKYNEEMFQGGKMTET